MDCPANRRRFEGVAKRDVDLLLVLRSDVENAEVCPGIGGAEDAQRDGGQSDAVHGNLLGGD
jgi:hypothetical protein